MYGVILKGPDYYLSYFELLSLLEAYNAEKNIIKWEGKLVLLKDINERIFNRLAFSKYLFKVEGTVNPEEFYLDKEIRPIIINNGGVYDVFSRVKFNSKAEQYIIVKNKDSIYYGKLLSVNRVPKERAPHNRPCFHPSSLVPTLARALINLSRAVEGDTLYDPFCGPGGILIEAGLMGIRVVGSDYNPAMIECAKQNLEHYGIKDYQLRVCDARELCFNDFDVIATDPPYGRYSKVHGESSIKKLYREFLKRARDRVKKGYISMFIPETVKPQSIIPDGYKVLLYRKWEAPGIKRYFLVLRVI